MSETQRHSGDATHYEGDSCPGGWSVIEGDSSNFEVLRQRGFDYAFVDAVVTDPPYGLDMAGWDYGVPPAAHWLRIRGVTKPGGLLVAFGGTRMWHRLACGIEDAGWDILADSGAWLYGTGFAKGKRCLRPAIEPIIIARNPGSGGVRAQAMQAKTGKWPTNVILSDEDLEGVPAGIFYVPKPSVKEKDAGLKEAGIAPTMVESLASRLSGSGPKERYNTHPTVKPIAMMEYLIDLVTDPGDLVMDPFCGSGTTGCAARLAGRRFVGIEMDPKFVEIARARIAHWEGQR